MTKVLYTSKDSKNTSGGDEWEISDTKLPLSKSNRNIINSPSASKKKLSVCDSD